MFIYKMLNWTFKDSCLVILLIVFFVFWYYNVFKIKKKRDLKNNPLTQYLYLTAVAYLFYPIQILDFLFFDTILTGTLGYRISLGNALAIAATGFGHYFYISFAAIVFNGTSYNPKKKILIKYLEIIICGLYVLLKVINQQELAIILLGGHMIIGFYVFFYLFIRFIGVRRNAEDPAVKKSFLWIAISALNLIITYAFIFADGAVAPTSTTYFSITGIAFGILIAFEFYMGYIYYPALVVKDKNIK